MSLLPLFGGTEGRFALGELLPDGTLRTIWDRGIVNGLAFDQGRLQDSVLISGPTDDGRIRSRLVALDDGGDRLLGEPSDRVNALARAGRWVAFLAPSGRGSRVGVLHLDTGERRLLTDSTAVARGVEFVADSSLLMYRRAVDRQQVATMDLTTILGRLK